jgi:hypothetical protein
VGPRARLDDVEKRKFLTLPGWISDSSVVQPVTVKVNTDIFRLFFLSPLLKEG